MNNYQKISFRGSLADDIAKQLLLSGGETSIREIMNEMLQANPDAFILRSRIGRLIVGKKSDVGHYPPDW